MKWPELSQAQRERVLHTLEMDRAMTGKVAEDAGRFGLSARHEQLSEDLLALDAAIALLNEGFDHVQQS